jgi:hypothetical protein
MHIRNKNRMLEINQNKASRHLKKSVQISFCGWQEQKNLKKIIDDKFLVFWRKLELKKKKLRIWSF